MIGITIDTGFAINCNTSAKDAFNRILFSTTKIVPYVGSDGTPRGCLTKPMIDRAVAGNDFHKGIMTEINRQNEDTSYVVLPLKQACPQMADLVPSESFYGSIATSMCDEYLVYDKPIIFTDKKGMAIGITVINKED